MVSKSVPTSGASSVRFRLIIVRASLTQPYMNSHTAPTRAQPPAARRRGAHVRIGCGGPHRVRLRAWRMSAILPRLQAFGELFEHELQLECEERPTKLVSGPTSYPKIEVVSTGRRVVRNAGGSRTNSKPGCSRLSWLPGSTCGYQSVLARNRTWSTTFARSRACPVHSEDKIAENREEDSVVRLLPYASALRSSPSASPLGQRPASAHRMASLGSSLP